MSNTLPVSTRHHATRVRRAGWPVFFVLVLSMPATAQTVAGGAIVNVATVRYTAGGVMSEVRSNANVVTVAERIDVALADVSAGGGTAAAMLVNAGSGSESFVVVATRADRGSAAIAVDSDGDGVYDPARDRMAVEGRTAVLPAGTSVRLFLVDAGTGPVTLTATAATGSGVPGTTFAGQGDGGSDAVVGTTGATASIVLGSGAAESPVLAKSQSVVAPDGGTRPIRGAIVSYTLAATFPAAARAVAIDDAVPAGARYIVGSLRLDGVAMSDAADDDAGRFDGGAIHVAIGDVAAGAARTVTFQTSLQ